jgi:hypothetical protein
MKRNRYDFQGRGNGRGGGGGGVHQHYGPRHGAGRGGGVIGGGRRVGRGGRAPSEADLSELDLFKPSFLEDPWASLEQAFNSFHDTRAPVPSNEAAGLFREEEQSQGAARQNFDLVSAQVVQGDAVLMHSSNPSVGEVPLSGAALELDIDDII